MQLSIVDFVQAFRTERAAKTLALISPRPQPIAAALLGSAPSSTATLAPPEVVIAPVSPPLAEAKPEDRQKLDALKAAAERSITEMLEALERLYHEAVSAPSVEEAYALAKLAVQIRKSAAGQPQSTEVVRRPQQAVPMSADALYKVQALKNSTASAFIEIQEHLQREKASLQATQKMSKSVAIARAVAQLRKTVRQYYNQE